MLNYVDKINQNTGFNFENSQRNSLMISETDLKKTFKKTGTTIVGLLTKDSVIIAADTRATNGGVVAEKNIQKIHVITDHICVCGAGTAADNDYVAKKISAEMEMMELNYGRKTPVRSLVARVS